MGLFLGIDVGTQSVKALCFDPESRCVVAESSSPLALTSREDGTREQLAQWWVCALERCMAALDAKTRESIVAIGVSGQQHGFVPLSATGEVLAPVKLWCDTTTGRQCEEIMNAFGGAERCIHEVGNPILPGYTAAKILWLKQNLPHLYARLDIVLLPHDYINFYLTGERVMEYGDASGTGLLDIRNRVWHEAMIGALDPGRDLMECFPDLVSPDRFIGALRAGVANQLGLPAGIPVACGGGDNMMAAIGTGNVSPGRMTVSLGTSGTLFAYADSPVIDNTSALAAFCDSTGGWLPLLCTMNCTGATELTRGLFGFSVEEMASVVEPVPAGSEGVMTLPYFQGERTPDLPRGRGCIFGLNHNNYTPGHLLRSAMESAVYGLRIGLDLFRQQDCGVATVRVTGGGAKSPVWRQMVADIFGLPVTVQKVDEGAALGAALQACWVYENSRGNRSPLATLLDHVLELDGGRCCEPDAPSAAVYADCYQDYRRHVEAVVPLYE